MIVRTRAIRVALDARAFELAMRTLDGLFLAMLVAVVAVALLPSLVELSGRELVTLTSDSMGPTWPAGSLVVGVPVETPERLRVGDAIVFRDVGDRRVTHRIVAISGSGPGARFMTRGDAAGRADATPVPFDRVVWRVELGVPALGMLLAWMFSPIGIVAIIVAAGIAHVSLGLLEEDLAALARRSGGGA